MPVIVRGEVKNEGGEESCEKKREVRPALPCCNPPSNTQYGELPLKAYEYKLNE